MATGIQYKELRALTVQAVQALGERRAAMLTGCSLSSIQTWLRRPQAHIMRKTIERSLPRLRRWQEWIPGYEAAAAEMEAMHAQAPPLDALAAEFSARLTAAAGQWTILQIAYACEVPVSYLGRWGAGAAPECERDDIVRALGHLRHVALWPVLQPAIARASMAGHRSPLTRPVNAVKEVIRHLDDR